MAEAIKHPHPTRVLLTYRQMVRGEREGAEREVQNENWQAGEGGAVPGDAFGSLAPTSPCVPTLP